MKSGLWSTPVTVPAKPSRAAIARVTTPVPQPRSRTAAVRGRSMSVEVGLAVGHERRILGAELEPLDEPLARRGVLLVDELHRVAGLDLCRHRSPSDLHVYLPRQVGGHPGSRP